MNKIMSLAAMLVLLAGCTGVANSANRAYDSTRAGIYNSAGKVQELMQYHPDSNEPQMPQTRYCYRSMADIICYEEPQPHISNQLFGYQGVPPRMVPQGGYRPAPGERYGSQKAALAREADETFYAVDGTEVTPFYGKQDSYKKPGGETVESSRAVISRDGSIAIGDLPPPAPATGAPASAPNEPVGGPRRLMTRY